MKNTRNLSKAILTVAVLLLAAVFLISLTSKVALADDFTVEYPISGYVQIVNSDLIAANADYVAVCDTTNNKISVSGNVDATISTDGLVVRGIYIFGNTLLADCVSGTKCVDLSETSPVLTDATLTTPSNISYFTSDGISLYAHTSGTIAKYADGLTLDATYLDSAFTDKPVFVSDGEKIYLYPVEYGIYKYAVYDTASGNSTKVNSSITACAAAIGNVIYVYDTNSILAVSKFDGSVLFDTEITASVFAAYGNKLYTANGADGYAIYTLNNDQTAIELTGSYAMSGNELDKLDSPSDIAVTADSYVIADTDNDRILFAGQNASSITMPSPHRLAAGKNRVYAANGNTVSVIENGGISASYAIGNVVDITYLDRLYVLTNSKLYTLIGGALEEIANLSNGQAITACEDGSMLYVMTDSAVKFINKQGEEIIHEFATTENKDITVDYSGNIFLLKNSNQIEKVDLINLYNHTYLGAPLSANVIYEFNNPNYSATASAITLHTNGKIYFTANENFIGALTVTANIKSDFTPTAIPSINTVEAKPYTLNADTICFVEPKRFDTAEVAPDGATVYIFETNSGLNAYKYGFYHDKLLYIADNSHLEEMQVSGINSEYLTTKNTVLYHFPGSTSDNISLEVGHNVFILDDAGGVDDNKWYRAKHNAAIYYIARTDVEVYIPPVDKPEDNTVYGKAKAERAGGTVNVYTSADTMSDVLVSITDGTEVIILNTLDNFYYVECGDYIGYMLKDTVELDGLTTVQIVAIVLSVVVILAGIGVFFVTKRIKDKAEEEN